MPTPTTVRCSGCHRVEQWDGDTRRVQAEGGARRPQGHRDLAAWTSLLEARRAGRNVVGRCPACAQPLVADGRELDVGAWCLALPQGDLLVGDVLLGPDGPMTEDAADRWVRAQLPAGRRSTAGEVAFGSIGLMLAAALFVAWAGAGVFVAWFIIAGAPRGAMGMP